MTDRIKGLTVSLTQDIREDDCQRIVDAISMINGVGSVVPLITDHNDWLAREHVREEVKEKVLKLYNEISGR